MRYYDADHQAYDQRGVTLLTALFIPARHRLRVRLDSVDRVQAHIDFSITDRLPRDATG